MGALEDFECNAAETRRGRLGLLAVFMLLWIGICLYYASQRGKAGEITITVNPQTFDAAEPGTRP